MSQDQSLTDTQTIIVQYNVPRFVLGRPGSQFRACTGDMKVTPGLFEAFDFHYSNSDGVSLNLNGLTLRLVFYYPQEEYEMLAANLQTNLVLAKDMRVSDPYSGVATMLLTDQETLKLAEPGRSTLRWAVYFINTDKQAFAAQITSEGHRYGICHLDRSEIPNTETILGTTVST